MEVSKLFAQHPRRNTLERSDQIGQGHLGRIVDQQMYVIVFAVELHQLGIKILADACENQLHGIEMLFLPEYEKEVKWANDTLDALQSVFKNIIYVMGNHCAPRVNFFVNNHCPEAYKPHFNFVQNLKLPQRKIGWVEYNDWIDIGNLTITHGMTHGSTCVKRHYELSGGRNVAFSHVHTAECKTFASRGVTRAVWSLPSMANLNPHYIKNSDVAWQNGYGTFTMKPNGNFNMNIHLVIDNEMCLPTGEVLKG